MLTKTLTLLTALLTLTHATPTHTYHRRQATVNETTTGVYTCSLPNWKGGCTWEDTSGMPRCRMIPWTDALTHSPPQALNNTTNSNNSTPNANSGSPLLARVSVGPDAGNHCILYENARCDDGNGDGGDGKGSYLLRYPGTTDMYEWARGQGLNGNGTGLYSMLCLTEGLIQYYYKPKEGEKL